jgi:hypothetical protein
VTLDSGFFAAGLVAEATTLAFLIAKRAYRTLPIFSIYVAWSLLNDVSEVFLMQHFPSAAIRIYFNFAIIDAVFQFAVLVELSMSVLRPVRALLPRWVLFGVGILIALACGAIWPVVKPADIRLLTHDSAMLIQLQQTFAVLRILFFLALAGLSQFLSISWRDRELQIATGLGFYSLVSLSVSLLHAQQALASQAQKMQFHILDLMVVASYLCSMAYWSFCFAQKVPERREFTPQMQNLLLAVAGTARSTRMVLDANDKLGKRDRE